MRAAMAVLVSHSTQLVIGWGGRGRVANGPAPLLAEIAGLQRQSCRLRWAPVRRAREANTCCDTDTPGPHTRVSSLGHGARHSHVLITAHLR